MAGTNIEINGIFPGDKVITETLKETVTDFLFHHLDEFGDKKEDILKAINYALDEKSGKGGFVVTAKMENELVGALVVNETGMKGYIPENILVYIAVHDKSRGKGVGKMLMEYAILNSKGNIALHVEPDNPARHLYEKLGFTNKYIEMRLVKS